MKIIHIIPVLMSVMLLSACGGSSSSDSDDGDSSTPVVPPPAESVPGGTPSSPAVMSLELKNEISSDSFHNYFTYTAKKGDQIFIKVTLDVPLSDRWLARCGASGSGVGYVGIRMDGDFLTCGGSWNHIFTSDGTHTFQFGYPDSGGYFETDVIPSTSIASDFNGTYVLTVKNYSLSCSVIADGSMHLNDGDITGDATDVNNGETISFSGLVDDYGFMDGNLTFSFAGNTGSFSGAMTISGSGAGEWSDENDCYGTWTAVKN